VIIKAHQFTITENELSNSLNSDSRREVDENFAAPVYHGANSGDLVRTFRDNYWYQLQSSIIQIFNVRETKKDS